jgi:Plasmid pRiA4b ORF-3-like protein
MNMTSRPDWTLDIRLEKALPFDQDRALPLCIGGSRAAPPEDCAGAWDYLERLDRHKYHPPIEELGIMAEAMTARIVALYLTEIDNRG